MGENKPSQKKERKPRRTRLLIRKDIFDAVSEIIKKEGFTKLSVNQIAEYAGMEPIVITRNFKSIDSIIEQYVERFDFWLGFFELKDPSEVEMSREYYKSFIESLIDVVYRKKEIRQLLAWEVAEDSSFTNGLAQRRESGGEELLEKVATRFKGSGIKGDIISAIFISSVYYLSMHKDRSPFCGVDMGGKEGKKILTDGIMFLIDLVFDKLEKVTEKEIAKKLLKNKVSVEIIAESTGLSKEEILEINAPKKVDIEG